MEKQISGNQIQVREFSEAEMSKAFGGASTKKPASQTKTSSGYTFEDDDGVALKLRGLPY